eukprot:2918706-Rhodomonas_salina.2
MSDVEAGCCSRGGEEDGEVWNGCWPIVKADRGRRRKRERGGTGLEHTISPLRFYDRQPGPAVPRFTQLSLSQRDARVLGREGLKRLRRREFRRGGEGRRGSREEVLEPEEPVQARGHTGT